MPPPTWLRRLVKGPGESSIGFLDQCCDAIIGVSRFLSLTFFRRLTQEGVCATGKAQENQQIPEVFRPIKAMYS